MPCGHFEILQMRVLGKHLRFPGENTMPTLNKKSLSRSVAILAFAASTHLVSAAPATQEVSDARQESQIWTTFALSPNLRATDIKVTVLNGKATLSGSVGEDISKELAKQIALGVEGIKEVDNQITVQADYVPPKPSPQRSYGELIDDATIASSIKGKLMWSTYTNGLTTSVVSVSSKVTLRGSADSAAAKELAGRLAMNTRGVVSVDNQLVINPDKPTLADTAAITANTAGHEMADGWITTKVKSTFLYSSNVTGSNITVSTNAGVVTLSGKLYSAAERSQAIELAQNVRGVKSVQAAALTY